MEDELIFEWYSGSDITNTVPQRIRALSELRKSMSDEEVINYSQKTIALEANRNWLGFLKYYLALQTDVAGNREEAIRVLREALGDFDPLASNFRDVELEYANCLLVLARELYYEGETYSEELLELSLRVVPFFSLIEKSKRDPEDHFDLLSIVGGAIFEEAKLLQDSRLYRIALEFFLRAHHLRTEDYGTLERVFYCYFALDMTERAKEVFQQFEDLEKRLAFDYEFSTRFRSFFQRVYSE
jgi:tetratricopeptide (TPR) repeat protein